MTIETVDRDDSAIVASVRAGRLDAYAEIVQRHQHGVWRVAALALDRTVAEDIVQQTFLNAFVHLDRFDPERDLGAWLRGIARNLVGQELRRRMRADRRWNRYGEQMLPSFEDGAAEDARQSALRTALEDCRGYVTGDGARALTLRYDEGLDFTAIAGFLGRSVAGTRQLLQRVRLNLRDCIEERMATP